MFSFCVPAPALCASRLLSPFWCVCTHTCTAAFNMKNQQNALHQSLVFLCVFTLCGVWLMLNGNKACLMLCQQCINKQMSTLSKAINCTVWESIEWHQEWTSECTGSFNVHVFSLCYIFSLCNLIERTGKVFSWLPRPPEALTNWIASCLQRKCLVRLLQWLLGHITVRLYSLQRPSNQDITRYGIISRKKQLSLSTNEECLRYYFGLQVEASSKIVCVVGGVLLTHYDIITERHCL